MLTDLTSTDEFHALRLNTQWAAAPVEQRTAAIYRASDYVIAMYAVDGHETEARVTMAVQMLAAEMLAQPLSVAAAEPTLLSEEERLGKDAIVEKRTYAKPASSDRYPLVTAILAPIPFRAQEQSKGATLTTVSLVRA